VSSEPRSPAAQQDVRPVGRGPRALLYVFGALTLVATAVLYGLADATDRYFAWTIEPPVTAAFLGAGYAAGFVAVVVSLRQGMWAPIRLGLQSIFVFVTATTIATLVHLDRFHLDRSGLPFAAAVLWLIVYLALPVWIAVVLLRHRARGRWSVPGALPPAARVVLIAQGVVLGALGVTLLVAPASSEYLWPWELTSLTARAVAAWILTLAVAALLATREATIPVLRVPAAIYLSVAILMAGALARFPEQVDWGRPAAWLVLVLLLVVAVTGLVGLLNGRRGGRGGSLT
jgi:hypothetical protein